MERRVTRSQSNLMINDDGRGQPNDDDDQSSTHGRFESRTSRDVLAGGERRGTEDPPDPRATLETVSTLNMFVRRGVGHDAAANRPSPLDVSAAAPPVRAAVDASFTSGAQQRGASQGHSDHHQHHQSGVVDANDISGDSSDELDRGDPHYAQSLHRGDVDLDGLNANLKIVRHASTLAVLRNGAVTRTVTWE